MTRLGVQVCLAAVVTAMVILGAWWWLLIPSWSVVIVTAIRDKRASS